MSQWDQSYQQNDYSQYAGIYSDFREQSQYGDFNRQRLPSVVEKNFSTSVPIQKTVNTDKITIQSLQLHRLQASSSGQNLLL
jgi:hypothetical protein